MERLSKRRGRQHLKGFEGTAVDDFREQVMGCLSRGQAGGARVEVLWTTNAWVVGEEEAK